MMCVGRMTRLMFSVFGALLVVSTIGCATQRPATAIRQDADFHYTYGHYERAAQDYQAITAKYPGDWEAQYRLGLSLMQLNEYDPARRALEVAHTLKPENADIVDALAETMYEQGDASRLFAFLRERAQSTQSVRAYRRLAEYALAMDDPDTARSAIETAIALDDGQSVEPYLDAAKLAERLGNIDQALRRLRQAYSINPHDQRVRERIVALGEVPGPSIALPPGR